MDNENVKGADALIAKLKEAKLYISTQVQEVVGTEAVRHFKQNFKEEAYDGNKWEARKTKTSLDRKILTGQGSGDHLGDSIDYKVEGNTIIIYSDKVYAEIHNEGGEIIVTDKMKKFFWAKNKEAKDAGDSDLAEQYKYMALSKKIVIPQRKFMDNSEKLNEKIISKITRDLSTILNS